MHEQTSFQFTPEQKGILATLSRETGEPLPALLAEALQVLQEHERLSPSARRCPQYLSVHHTVTFVLEIFREAREGIPEEIWKALPKDLPPNMTIISTVPRNVLMRRLLPMRSTGLPFCMWVTSGINGCWRSPRCLAIIMCT